jgi:hypothetical protein
VTAVPGRSLLTEANRIFVQRDWKKVSKESESKGSTQLQQPLLNDAWKHLEVSFGSTA